MSKCCRLYSFFPAVLLGVCSFHVASCQVSDLPAYNTGEVASVIIPPIPGKLSFASENVPLDYYDTRESLEEDLAVTMYMHSKTLKTLRATKRYFPVIEPILEKYGVPADFKYLAVAESGLDPEAYSPAKAAGLWQILATTGKEYGLEVGTGVDERYDVEKSTIAACKYLKKAYERFGSWTLAAASYNAGMAGISRRMASQGEQNYYDLFLPTETMRYIFRILSFKLVERDPSAYGFYIDPEQYYEPYRYAVVEVSDRKINWSDVAHQYGTNYKLLRELNPWIRGYQHDNVSGKTYKVKIPEANFRTEAR